MNLKIPKVAQDTAKIISCTSGLILSMTSEFKSIHTIPNTQTNIIAIMYSKSIRKLFVTSGSFFSWKSNSVRRLLLIFLVVLKRIALYVCLFLSLAFRLRLQPI